MFFAYNNGITATAQSVETRMMDSGLAITRVVDLQIVNGGQTTASLFHTRKRDKADISRIFVQLKLSVIDSEQSEMVVLGIWNAQKLDPVLESAIAVVSGVVNDDIIRPPQGISNISEWCKKEACWTRIQARTDAIANLLPPEFYDRLVPQDDQAAIVKTAKQTQRIDNGIEAQRKVLAVPAAEWARIHQLLLEKGLLTPKEAGVLRIAMQTPTKVPTERQCAVLLDILGRGGAEGIVTPTDE